jgi:hypothetical protein
LDRAFIANANSWVVGNSFIFLVYIAWKM